MQESVISFHRVGPEDQTQVVGLDGKSHSTQSSVERLSGSAYTWAYTLVELEKASLHPTRYFNILNKKQREQGWRGGPAGTRVQFPDPISDSSHVTATPVPRDRMPSCADVHTDTHTYT